MHREKPTNEVGNRGNKRRLRTPLAGQGFEARSFRAIATSSRVDTAAKAMPIGLFFSFLLCGAPSPPCSAADSSPPPAAAVVVVVPEALSGALAGVTAGATVVVVAPFAA